MPKNRYFCIHGVDLDCRCYACDEENSEGIEERLDSVWRNYHLHRKIMWTVVVTTVLFLLIIIVFIR